MRKRPPPALLLLLPLPPLLLLLPPPRPTRPMPVMMAMARAGGVTGPATGTWPGRAPPTQGRRGCAKKKWREGTSQSVTLSARWVRHRGG